MGQLQVTGQQDGVPGTPTLQIGPFSLPTGLAVKNDQVTLSSGNNTIALPTVPTPSGVMVIAPTGSTTELIFKGTTGADTGVPMNPNGLSLVLVYDPAHVPSQIVVNAAATVTVVVQVF